MILTNLKKRVYTSLALFVLIFLIVKYDSILLYFLILSGVFSSIEFLTILKKIYKNKFYILISSLLFVSYIFLFCSMFYLLSSFLQTKIILYSLLLTCIASDIGGFIFGKIFKGPKLTKLSPGKTYSGALGSIFLSLSTFSLIIFYYTKNFNYEFIITGIFISIACQFGDLFFSLLKRKAKLKDTGNILPGHGGILDRLDSILFGMPVGFLLLIILL